MHFRLFGSFRYTRFSNCNFHLLKQAVEGHHGKHVQCGTGRGVQDFQAMRGGPGAGEPGVFRKEAVAGVYGVRAGELGSGDDPGDVEVGLGGGRAGKVHGLVGVGDVPRVGVGGVGEFVCRGACHCVGCLLPQRF